MHNRIGISSASQRFSSPWCYRHQFSTRSLTHRLSWPTFFAVVMRLGLSVQSKAHPSSPSSVALLSLHLVYPLLLSLLSDLGSFAVVLLTKVGSACCFCIRIAFAPSPNPAGLGFCLLPHWLCSALKACEFFSTGIFIHDAAAPVFFILRIFKAIFC